MTATSHTDLLREYEELLQWIVPTASEDPPCTLETPADCHCKFCRTMGCLDRKMRAVTAALTDDLVAGDKP